VVERRLAEGRTQEWNSSRAEMQAFVEAGLLSQEELEACITSEYNPVRCVRACMLVVGFAAFC